MRCTVTVTAEGLTQKPGCWRRSSYGGSVVRYWIEYDSGKLKDACHGADRHGTVCPDRWGSWMSCDEHLQSEHERTEWCLYSSICSYLMILHLANLGVMNQFRIPALDGGRLAFLVIEVITRQASTAGSRGYVHMIGMGFAVAFDGIRHVLYDIQRVFF